MGKAAKWVLSETDFLPTGDLSELLEANLQTMPMRGEARSALWAGMGIEMQRVVVEESEAWSPAPAASSSSGPSSSQPVAPAGPGKQLSDFDRLDVVENPTDFAEWDRAGLVWGRPGHFPLWVTLGCVRNKTEAAKSEASRKNNKKYIFTRGGNWPWWIYHESEGTYWLPGGYDQSRGFSGSAEHSLSIA